MAGVGITGSFMGTAAVTALAPADDAVTGLSGDRLVVGLDCTRRACAPRTAGTQRSQMSAIRTARVLPITDVQRVVTPIPARRHAVRSQPAGLKDLAGSPLPRSSLSGGIGSTRRPAARESRSPGRPASSSAGRSTMACSRWPTLGHCRLAAAPCTRKPHHPVPRCRRDGRVVKGVDFVDFRDAGDPVELAARLRPGGRRRAHLPRHHRPHDRRETIIDLARADRRAGVHPVHHRRGGPHRRRRARLPRGRHRQGRP